MENSIKTSALILTRTPYREFNGSVVAFTKTHGTMRLTAMGLYRQNAKLSSVLLAGNVCYLTLSKGTHWHITGAKAIKSFATSFFEPRLLYLSSIVREILLELFHEEESQEDIFKKAVDCFTLLTSDRHSIHTKELIVYRFIISCFLVQGLLPDFSKCSRDGKRLGLDEERFWKLERGLLCKKCKGSTDDDFLTLPSSLAAIPTYTTADTLSKEERQSLTTMVQDIYSHGHKERLKSLAVWQESFG